MKRFTETLKWDDPWFRALAGAHKLVFLYVIDRCDNAGFWEVDEDAVTFHTRLSKEHVEGAWKALTRGLVGASGWVWVRNFLKHQKNDVLKAENPAHRQIISLIKSQLERFGGSEEFRGFVAPYKGLLRPIGTGTGTGKNGEGMQGERSKKATATPDEIADFFAAEGLKRADAEWFYEKCVGNGWTNAGKPIRDWKATVRSWRAARYLPSQKSEIEKAPIRGKV